MNLKTLGALRLEPPSFTQPKPLLLLSYLVIEGAQPRRHVAELFWGAGNSMKSLSMAITRLRQGAGDVIEADNKKTWVKVESDVALLLESLDKSQWERAANLYTGAFLEGVVLEDWSNELEEWVYTTREYLAERVQYALLNLAEDAAKEQDFSKARDLAERAYNLPGLASQEVASLKRLYPLLSASNSSFAPEVRKELAGYGIGVQLAHEEARAAFQKHSESVRLPTRQTSFVGRDVELTELAAMLEGSQLLTILGTAGVGKTRLALQFAHEQQKLGVYEGVYFVALESLEAGERIFPALLEALGLSQQDKTDPLTQLIEFVGQRSVLLILDNLEHLVQHTEGFSRFLRDCPNLRLLVTSRERLGLEEEHLFPLEGLAFPPPYTPFEEAVTFDAVTLFGERAQQLQPQFDLKQQLESVINICQLVEGLPLGLELSASWVRLMSCQEIAEEIQRNFDFLSTNTRNVPERHRSLRAALEYSWSLLTAKEKAVFCKLSTFRGGFRREAASRVAGATLPVLASLVDKSLLRVLPNGRYDQHPLIYQYAREALHERGEFQEADAQHLSYYLTLVQAQEEALLHGKQAEVLRVFHEEWDNCNVLAEKILVSGDPALLLRWVDLVDTFYDVRGAYVEAVDFLTRAETTLIDNPKLLGRVLLEKGYALLWLGRFDESKAAVLQGLALVPTEKQWRARGLNTLGILAFNVGDFTKTFEHWREALNLASSTGYTIYEAHITGNLGNLEAERDNLEASERYHQQSLELYQNLGAVNGYAREHVHIALTYFMGGELAKAKTFVSDGLQLMRKIGYKLYLPHGLVVLGRIEHALGDYARARDVNLEALTLSRETGDKFVEAQALAGLVLTFAALHDLQTSSSYSQKAVQLAHQLGSDALLSEALQAKAELFYSLGEVGLAAKLLGVIVQHPATRGYVRKTSQSTLERLEKQLSHKQLAAVKTFVQGASLEGALAIGLELPVH
jgi:predicted ATPase